MEEENKVKDEHKNPSYVKFKKFHFIMGVFLLIFLTAGITTIALTFGDEKVQPNIVNQRSEFNKLYETFDTIESQYYTKVDKEKLVNGAINGMIDSLDDPYSDYMDIAEAENFHNVISSSFEGIGAEIQEKDSKIVIVSPIKGSPAEKAGLKPNDIVLSVNGKSLEGLSSTEAVSKIRGKKGTKVALIIQRGQEEPFTVNLVRDTIPIETVYAEMLDNNIAKIHVSSFSDNTTVELTKALEEMKAKGMKGLVLDLRGNPGGIMEQAMQIASMFVPKDKALFQIEDRNGNKQVIKSENSNVATFPVVVLIDEGSASASEIVAAAVKESAGIPLVGEKSFGKGTIQTAKDLEDGSNIKYTTGKWLTPNGTWIHKKGIEPDVKVALPSYAHLTYISPDKELKEGTTSSEVKVAEQMLEALGYKPGKVDGIYDENTKTAVMQLQKDVKLEQNGILKDKTTLALMNKLREKILANDTQLNKAVEILTEKMK
ncbi:S41 family peptidase [Bacillus massiliigorillae]|uniref:lmo1851 family serine protease n=1 Tax=Bacillus massiliigorillae TaxID=1243664 RepID=UPI0003A1F5DF|nr:S41 family peptidase [Bacillus massiliigorillae]